MTHDLPDGLPDGLPDPGAGAVSAVSEQTRAALDEAGTWLGDRVVAVGLGRTDDGQPCVVAHVSAPAPELPAEVEGVPVRVVDSGPVLAEPEPGSEPEDQV